MSFVIKPIDAILSRDTDTFTKMVDILLSRILILLSKLVTNNKRQKYVMKEEKTLLGILIYVLIMSNKPYFL